MFSSYGAKVLGGIGTVRYRRFFAIGLGLALVLSLLLTPLGFETRPLSTVTLWGMVGLGAYSVGFVLRLVSLVLLMWNRRGFAAAVMGAVGQLLFYPIILIDLSGNFSSLPPPSAIPPIEIVAMVVSLVTIFFAINGLVKRIL